MNNSTPRISIVTPSYNQGQFLAETIESVLSQEGDFFIDYIIADGGSTDNSVEVIKKYERLLKAGEFPVKCRGIEYRWWSRPDKGQSAAVNEGLKAARGDIIGWINSDDLFEPGAFEIAVEFLRRRPEVDLVYGRGAHIDERGAFIEWYPTQPFNFSRLLRACYICQPAVFFRRTVLDKVGLLNADLHYCMDYDYWLRAAGAAKFAYLEKHLASVRFYSETKTLSGRVESYGEVVQMLKGRFKYVPGEWIYGWSKAKLNERMSREGFVGELRFLLALLWTSSAEYVRINKRLPLRESLGWLSKLMRGFKGNSANA